MHGPCGIEGCDCGHTIERLKAELSALIGLEETGLDELLERWDLTDPVMQRKIVARFVSLYTTVKKQRDELLAAAKEAIVVVDEAYQATGYIKVAKTSQQRMRLESAIANCKE